MSDYTSHWDHVYNTKTPSELGWYQPHLSTSLELILRTGIGQESHIIDVGGGSSTLVDDLLAQGFRHITVLDISAQALTMAKARLGKKAGDIEWIIADIRHADLPHRTYDVWHDRALFHFLTDAEDPRKYLDVVLHTLKPEGYLIVATFALDAPPRCSGLEVVRYDPQGLEAEFGDEVKLIETRREVHQTPSGIRQPYNFCLFQRVQ